MRLVAIQSKWVRPVPRECFESVVRCGLTEVLRLLAINDERYVEECVC